MAMAPDELAATLDVSRETLQHLQQYADLLRKWQRAINLVAGQTLDDLWRRHFLDSGQLKFFLPPGIRSIADIGSGAGFPGLVLAILGVPEVHLIESDSRKCLFLAEAAREVGLEPGRNPVIHNVRAERLTNLRVDAVTSRACARLDVLLGYSLPLVRAGGACLLLKGAKVEEELTDAAKSWHMEVERFASLSDPSGTILRISKLAPAG